MTGKKLENFNKTLRVKNVSMDDGGDYICTASNRMGSLDHVITVRVKCRILHYFIIIVHDCHYVDSPKNVLFILFYRTQIQNLKKVYAVLFHTIPVNAS